MGYFPVFVVLILLGVVLLWFLCSFLYKKLGSLVFHIWKKSRDIMNETEIIEESTDEKASEDKINKGEKE